MLGGFPTDITLPDSAKYYNFISTKKKFNSNYDITWSFQYKLPQSSISNSSNYELGFSTFLTNLAAPVSSLPGQYLGDQDPEFILSAHALLTEGLAPATSTSLKTESDSTILLESGILSGMLVKIAFDSTGLYALTGRDDRPGYNDTQLHRQALVIRDFEHNVKVNAPLSSISTSFSTLSTDTYRTLRFRYINLGRTLNIDIRESDTTTYTLLTSINLGLRLDDVTNLDNIYCGFSLCTPISTLDTSLSAEKFFLRDFQIEGYEGDEVLTETVVTSGFEVNPNQIYTTVSNITASPAS
tara:strand:+ start:14819 stop:15712 length:894 start_codon:yes stop_codon:yes gene_type:complete